MFIEIKASGQLKARVGGLSFHNWQDIKIVNSQPV